MFNFKKHYLLIFISILILLIIPTSFAADVDSNSTVQASDVDEIGIIDVNEDISSIDEPDKLSSGYDFECVPNETQIDYVLGTKYPIHLNYTDTEQLTYMTLLYAYINGDNAPITIKTPSGFDIYEGSGHAIVDIKSISPYLSVGENTVVFHPKDNAMAAANLVNNHYVPIKIIAIEPETPPTVYYVDSSVSKDGDGHEGSTFKTLATAISYANQKFSDEGGSIIIKKGKNGIYSEYSTMSITKNMTIAAESGADVTITSTNYESLFSQTTKANVIITGLTFKDMQIDYGAIYYQNTNAVDGSTLIIQNCTFINNEAPNLVRLYKTQATIKQVNFIENTLTADGINTGLVNYNEGGGSRWAPSPYKFDISYCNIVGNEYNDYLFSGSPWQSLTANNNYWGSNYASKPTGIYNRENTYNGDGDYLLTLNNWVFLNIAMSEGVISTGTSYPITFDFKQNDGSALAGNMADLDVSLSASGIINPSNVTISKNHAEATYIAPNMAKDTITVNCGSTTIYAKNIANIVSGYKYMSSPTVDSVEYLIGENKNIDIGIISDVAFSSSDKLYVYVGETEIDVGALTNNDLVTIDLKSISDKFAFVVGQNYTLYFHPKVSTLNGKGINNGEYLFNPLTLSVTGEYNPEPQVVYTATPKVGGKTIVDYSDDLVVSVNIVYDETSLSQSKLNTLNSGNMMIFINGAEIGAVNGINSGSKSFTVNLSDYKDEFIEGKNIISFHPATSLLKSVFGTHDILVLNNLTVNFVTPEPPYVSTPSLSYITYTKTTPCKITVIVTGTMVSEFYGSDMYMYLDGSTNGIRIPTVDSDATSFTVDLSDYDSYFTAGKTYSVIFRPPTGMFGYGYLPELDECEFNPIEVSVKSAPVINYISTPNETSVNYVFGASKKIRIDIDSDILPSLEQCYVYAWVNGEGTNDRFLINHIKGSDSSFTFDLADISNKLKEGENTVTFHVDSDFIEEATWSSDSYKFNPLTVYASFKQEDEMFYTNNLSPNNIAEYTNGTSKIITVTVSYNQTKASGFGYRPMYIYINGEEFVISTVYANSTSFTIDLANYSEYFAEGQNNISIHPQIKALKDVFQTNDESRFDLDNLTVNVIPTQVEIKYVSTATVNGSANVKYIINQHDNVQISVDCQLLDKFEYEKLYAWIGNNYNEINTMANEASATIDLKDLSDKFKFEEGQTYTIYFHPWVADLNEIGINEGEYVFNPLTVEIIGTYTPEPTVVYTSTPKVGDKTAVDYTIGENTFVTVNVVYNESYKENAGFSGKSMRMFINGDKTGVVISDVNANATSFTVNLADYITEAGDYNISFGPENSVLSWVFYSVDNHVVELNNLTVSATLDDYLYVTTPDPVSVVDYTNESKIITVSISYRSSAVNQLSAYPMNIYINGYKVKTLDSIKANVTSFNFDLADLSSYLFEYKTYYVSFHPNVTDLDEAFGNENHNFYMFNNLTVTLKDLTPEPVSTYNTTVVPNKTDYIIGESLNVSVSVEFDNYFNDSLSYLTMFVYINGEDMDYRVPIEGVYGNDTSFEFDLATIADKLVVGINNLTFHPHPDGLEGTVPGSYTFNKLIVNAIAKHKTNYTVTPSPSKVDYTIGDSSIIVVNVDYDDSFANALRDIPIYIYINDGVGIDTSVKANVNSFEFDLKSISEYLTVGKNSISFGPDKYGLTSMFSDVNPIYNVLTVNAENAPVNPDNTYVSTPTPDKAYYNLSESFNVTVSVVYDDYFNDDLNMYTMFVYINGEEFENRVAIDGVKGNDTTFVFDLKTISDRLVEGVNNLTFHPHPGALEGTFVGPYVYNKLTVIVGSTPEPINPMEYNGIIYVDVSGNDDNNGSAYSPVATIGKAIELASNDANTEHKIVIRQGIYKEHDLSINSPLDITTSGDVIINAEKLGRIFDINADEVKISGITFKNGKAIKGGAIYAKSEALTIENNVFDSNNAELGSAIYLESGNAILNKNTITDGDIYTHDCIINTKLTLTFIAPSKASVGKPVNISASLVDDMGNTILGVDVKVTANGEYVGKLGLVNCTSSIEFIPQDATEYVISGSASGVTNIINATIESTFEVSVDIPNVEGISGNALSIPVAVKLNGENANNDAVSVTFNGKTFDVAIVDGVANVSITLPEKAGIYDLTVSYMGEKQSGYVFADSKLGSVIAITTIDGNNVFGIVKDINGNPIVNADVKYTINGNAANIKAKADGTFTIEIPYDSETQFIFAGDNNTLPYNVTISIKEPAVPAPVSVKVETRFNITGNAITINGYAIDIKAGEEGMRYATQLLDANGKPISGVFIQFGVNNKIYNRTTYQNGSFDPYHLDMLRAGRYTMAFTFGGNDEYNSTFAVVCVDLDKKPITIKASAKTFKASTKTKKYTITLKTIVGSSFDGKAHLRTGLKVKLTVNGKTYSGKTDSKGKVTFKITKLSKKGKYIAKISYAGDMTYESVTKKAILTVK